MADQLAAAQKLQGQDLEKEVAALKQVRAASSLMLYLMTSDIAMSILATQKIVKPQIYCCLSMACKRSGRSYQALSDAVGSNCRQ